MVFRSFFFLSFLSIIMLTSFTVFFFLVLFSLSFFLILFVLFFCYNYRRTDGPTRRTDRARAALTRPRDSERTDKNDHVTSGTLPRRTASTDRVPSTEYRVPSTQIKRQKRYRERGKTPCGLFHFSILSPRFLPFLTFSFLFSFLSLFSSFSPHQSACKGEKERKRERERERERA